MMMAQEWVKTITVTQTRP